MCLINAHRDETSHKPDHKKLPTNGILLKLKWGANSELDGNVFDFEENFEAFLFMKMSELTSHKVPSTYCCYSCIIFPSPSSTSSSLSFLLSWKSLTKHSAKTEIHFKLILLSRANFNWIYDGKFTMAIYLSSNSEHKRRSGDISCLQGNEYELEVLKFYLRFRVEHRLVEWRKKFSMQLKLFVCSFFAVFLSDRYITTWAGNVDLMLDH